MRVAVMLAVAAVAGAGILRAQQRPPACPAGATCPIYEVAIVSTMTIRTAAQTTSTPTLSPAGTPVTIRQEHAGAVMTITGRGTFLTRLGPGALQDADYDLATPPEGVTAKMSWSNVTVTGGPCTHTVKVGPPTDYNFWLGLSQKPVPRAALVASPEGLELHQIISSKCEKGKGGGSSGMPIFSQAWTAAHGSGDDGDDASAKSSAEASEMLQGMDPAKLKTMQAEMQKKLKGRDPSTLSEAEMRALMTPDAAATVGQIGRNADAKLDAALDNFMIRIEGAGVTGGDDFADFTVSREVPMPGGQGTVTERTRIRIAARPSGKALFVPDTVPGEPDPSAPTEKKPSALKGALGSVAGTVGSAAGATLIDTLSGGAGKAVGARMGAGAGSCPPGYVAVGGAPTTGTMVVDAAKKGAKGKDAATAEGQGAATQCVPAGGGGMTPDQMASMQQQQGAQGMGGLNPAMMTPAGAAIAAAPVAIEGGKAAAKGVKKLFGLNAKTWQEMLAEYGEKGQVELKGVRFIASTTELEEGGEEVLATAAEAIAKARYPVAIHVEPEAGKGEEPDPLLAGQRREKLVAMLLAAGAPAANFAPGAEVPDELVPKQAKVARLGEAKVFVVRVKATP